MRSRKRLSSGSIRPSVPSSKINAAHHSAVSHPLTLCYKSWHTAISRIDFQNNSERSSVHFVAISLTVVICVPSRIVLTAVPKQQYGKPWLCSWRSLLGLSDIRSLRADILWLVMSSQELSRAGTHMPTTLSYFCSETIGSMAPSHGHQQWLSIKHSQRR